MSDTISVYRGDGTRQAADVVEPLLSDDVLRERGIAEMDRQAHEMVSEVVSVVFDPTIRLGMIFEGSDRKTAKPYRGKVTGISITMGGSDVTMNVTLEKPA